MARVGIIVCCGFSDADLQVTLSTLQAQTFSDFQAIVIGSNADGEVVASLRSKGGIDGRFTFFETSGSSIEQINESIKQLDSDAIAFALPGIEYDSQYFEHAYGVLCNGSADVTAAPYELIDFRKPSRRNWGFNSIRRFSKYDIALVNTLFPFDKLYRTALIKENGLYLEDRSLVSLWQFNASAVMASERVVACGYPIGVLYVVEPQKSWSVITNCYEKFLEGFTRAFDDARAFATSAIERDIRNYDEQGSFGDSERMKGLSHSYTRDLWSYELRMLLKFFVKRIWLLPKQSRQVLLEYVRDAKSNVPSKDLELIRTAYAEVEPVFDGSGFQGVITPKASFVITPECDKKTASQHIDALVKQAFPLFEIVIPKAMSNIALEFEGLDCIRLLDTGSKAGAFKNEAMSVVRGSYVNFLEDRIFWRNETFSNAYKRLEADRIDLGIVRPSKRFDKDKRRSMVLAYDKRRCLLSHQSRYNSLDNSLNNKIVRPSALAAKDLAFSDSPNNDSDALYQMLSYRKYRDLYMECFERDSFFIKRSVLPTRTFKAEYYFDRIKSGALIRASERIAEQSKGQWDSIRQEIVKPVNQILFFSNRGDGSLTPNLKAVYDALPECKKVVLTQKLPHSTAYRERIQKELLRSQIIVTDDYLHELEFVRLKPGQKVIQLWHAAGAFKKFGLDCFGAGITKEHVVHGCYTAVMVSSEGVREIYANAFGISPEKVLALGSPRTDELLDKKANLRIAKSLYAKHPDWASKQVVLYCPTFRQKMDKQIVWDTKIDWQALDDSFGNDTVLLVKKHPLEKFDLLSGSYKHIETVDHEATNDLLCIADLLITDYSSVVFDAALLGVPMLFYCPDLNTYERDFYLRFPDDLPGDLIIDSEKLTDGIRKAMEKGVDTRASEFREKYMGACDGHSAERIANYLVENCL